MNGESTAPAISSDGRVLLVATPNPHHLYRGIGSGDVFTLDPDPIDLTVETYDGSVTDDTIMIYARGLFAEITSVERTCNN
jgi:hypothetical protein